MNLYDIEVTTIDGKEITMGEFEGKVLLVVNVASKCGFTYQYEGLQKLHDEYADRGYSVLGFPCNQFLSQEPGTEQEIARFCSLTYGVSFPMFAKVNVNGSETHPLYQYLKGEKRGLLGGTIKWNFTKFLLDRQGAVVARFAPSKKPKALRSAIAALLPT